MRLGWWTPSWVRILRRRRPRRKRDWLGANEWVTHLGRQGKFPQAPMFEAGRHGFEWEVSVIRGIHGVEQASMWIKRRSAQSRDCVRQYCTTDLRQADYLCLATPTDQIPAHSSLYAPIDHRRDPEGAMAWWHDPARVTLDTVAMQSESRGVPQ